jgi:hypothetical protein
MGICVRSTAREPHQTEPAKPRAHIPLRLVGKGVCVLDDRPGLVPLQIPDPHPLEDLLDLRLVVLLVEAPKGLDGAAGCVGGRLRLVGWMAVGWE